jgi:hypothetical protein
MIGNVKLGPAAHIPYPGKQPEPKPPHAAAAAAAGVPDTFEYSGEAKALRSENLSRTRPAEIPEWQRAAASKPPDNTAAIEKNRELTAIRIAMRIANGDNVPQKDHEFLIEYDAKLYRAAMKAGMIAENKEPKNYDSLADDMLASEQALLDSDDSPTLTNPDGMVQSDIGEAEGSE